MGLKLMLNNVRCAFLVLGEPEDYQGNKRFRWSATALIPYGSLYKAAIDKALKEVAIEKWGKKGEAQYEALKDGAKECCFSDGKKKPDYDGFANHWALSVHRQKEKGRPLVMDKDKSPIYKPDNEFYEGKAGILYSGCFVNMQVEFYVTDKPNMGLRGGLLGIQKNRDGDAFGGGSAPSDDAFGEIAEGADAEDLT